MIDSIDRYFFRKYSRTNYNCAHLVCEVWKDWTGVDISGPMCGFLTGRGETKAILSNLRNFVKLDVPESPCVALFRSPKLSPHVGIFIRGKVLHITPRGVQYQPPCVVSFLFKRTDYYTWQQSA